MNEMCKRRRMVLVILGLALAVFGLLALAFAFSNDATLIEQVTMAPGLLPPGGLP